MDFHSKIGGCQMSDQDKGKKNQGHGGEYDIPRVNVNTASYEELRGKLFEFGAQLTQSLIVYRKILNGFDGPEDLRKIPFIGRGRAQAAAAFLDFSKPDDYSAPDVPQDILQERYRR